MGHGFCGGSLAPPSEPIGMPIASPTETNNGSSDEDPKSPDDGPLNSQDSLPLKPTGCCTAGKCKGTGKNDQSDAPDCCRGKVGPCCDTSCLDRLALRECSKNAVKHSSSGVCQPTSCDGATGSKACNHHSLSALDRYGATLQALGCICRSLIALGEKTCCEIRERRSLDEQKCSERSSARSLLRKSLDSGRSNDSVTRDQALQNHLRLRIGSGEVDKSVRGDCADSGRVSPCSIGKPLKKVHVKNKCSKPCCLSVQTSSSLEVDSLGSCLDRDNPSGDGCKKGKQGGLCRSKMEVAAENPACGSSGSCCASPEPVTSKKALNATCPDSCCKSPEGSAVEETSNSGQKDSCCNERKSSSPEATSCADACCSALPLDAYQQKKESQIKAIPDIEGQGTGNERVVLSISGMTCTGCETKLNRTLAALPAVADLKTSLVLSRAEFNVDLRLSTVEEVIKYLGRTTEFKCERVQDRGSSLDLVMPGDSSELIAQKWPDGVIDMTILDKQIIRVVFDPKTVGARDLVEKVWGPPIQLAPPRGDPSLEAGSKHVRNVGYMTLLSAALTIPVLVMAWAPLPPREVAYSSASLALATIVQVVIAGPFYPKALKALIFSKVIEMDLLIVLSTSAAYIFSVVSFGYSIAEKPPSTGQFFETSTLLVTLIMVGRWVAALARQRAVESISIRSLQSSTAILLDGNTGAEREIDARLLQYGDTFKVLPDTRIPTDGTVIDGSSEVDESMLTGESSPVEKYPNSVVIAGSINGGGVMTVRLNRLPSDNTINAIAAMVDEAKLSKPKLQDLADQVASYFVPVVVALTIITFVTWIAVGMTVRGYDGSEATIQAITYAITVLIVSCPCAIGLAVPMVIVIISGVAAERGIIFKSADAIEVAHKTLHVVFDKTRTLTRGKLSVVAEDSFLFPLLLVSKNDGILPSTVPHAKSLTGKGVEGDFNGQKLRAGNSRWLNLSENAIVQPMLAQGYTVLCFTIDDVLHAVYGLEDEVRSDAEDTIQTLQRGGVMVHVVSGDEERAVQTLASKLNIPCENVRSRSSPGDKKDYIQSLLGSETDRKKPVVVFCGDGTNDAVALAQATIGVHMNEGTDVAQSAADVVLMRPHLAGIPAIMNASRQSVNRIMFNFGWSFVYNTFAILLAAGAFVNARIPPKFAGLGELVSVLPVIAAAVLLRWSKI
ncbi:unnamed protein product [Penicillium salamii]|uniref:HMA domain-containing protein n=1 Tax=Penicillium salamii TaxID=1612424 RepID=A0A9W4JKI0_9EURO|nr:unnamed protein product [Penicillium salamii]CAG8052032.1 unnamed protein product [Penicillium salamii]CAG8165923.1 unnamed protein product [Penicillium salamii]CAG8176088.1 unnamed protein product [Penicillium salamii]CAG8206012.1 unnamed protein product [Penicillium salamii]